MTRDKLNHVVKFNVLNGNFAQCESEIRNTKHNEVGYVGDTKKKEFGKKSSKLNFGKGPVMLENVISKKNAVLEPSEVWVVDFNIWRRGGAAAPLFVKLKERISQEGKKLWS